jgi:hypothetical protein
LREELDGGLLLEGKAVTNGITGIDQQADSQGQVSLRTEVLNLCRRFVVVEQCNVNRFEIFYEAPMFVGNSEDQIHFIDHRPDRGGGLVVTARSRSFFFCRGIISRS